MRDAEGVTGDAFEEIALDGFGRGVGDRMDEAVQSFPVLAEVDEQLLDLRVFGDVALEQQIAAEFGGELGDAVLEALVLVGKGQFCTFAVAGLGDAVGNRMLRQNAGDEDALLCEESHECSLFCSLF